jgi:hypothetical protein
MAAAEAEGYSSSSRRLPVSSFSVSSSEEMNHPHQNPINNIIRNLMNPTRTYGNKRISLLTRPSDHRNVHLQMDECWYSLPHHTTNTQEATTDNHTAQRPTDITTQHRDPHKTHETFTFIITQNKKRPGALHTTSLPLHCGRGREQK